MSATRESASDICAVVLAGGSGTRLWPLSRGEFPKQLLKLSGKNSLLQDTILRLDGLGAGVGKNEAPPLLVVCHEEQRFLIQDQLEEIVRPPERILLEPESRNTAPALCSAAQFMRRQGGDPVMLVLPADHAVADAERFRAALADAVEIARKGFIVTLGVVPTRPDTGYGYIRRDSSVNVRVGKRARAHRIAAFVEKPNERVAASYVASGQYLWNSGVFILRASLWLEAVDRCRPELLDACREAVESGRDDDAFFRLGRDAYSRCDSDSIDYAVMERLSKSYVKPPDDGREGAPIPAAVVPLDAGWSDIGTWAALLEQLKEGDSGSSVQGDVVALETRNSLLLSSHRLVACYGLENTVVVETPDAVLVMDKNKTQGARAIVDRLNSQKRREARTHRLVHRPWGSYESLESREGFQVKRLTVKPGAKQSLQLHRRRAEHWVVVRGTARVTRGEEVFDLDPNESTFIPVETKHRLENPGKDPLELIEVQVGDYLGEDDIVRFEDDYHRVDNTA